MKIGVDVRPLYRPNLKGIGVYLKNLLDEFSRWDKENTYYLFYDERQELVKRKPDGQLFREEGSEISKGDSYYFWDQICLPREIAKNKIDIFHSPANMTSLKKMCPTVVTVHDTKPFEMKGYNFKEEIYTKWLQPKALRAADKIICPSEYTKKCIVEVLKIQPEKITVIYQGLSNRFKVLEDDDAILKVLQRLGVEKEYILFTGGETPAKNISRLIEAFAKLKKQYQIEHQLVITGIRSKKILEKHTQEIKEQSVALDVKILGYVEDDDLIALYNKAVVFVYPSLFEGFGFPPIEAMACGAVVAASNATSIPEVVGDAALMFDGKNVDEMAKQILRLITESNTINELREKGFKRSSQFKWLDTAQKTLNVYKELKK